MPAGQVFAGLPAGIRPILIQGLCFGTEVALCEPFYTPRRRLRTQLSPFRRELPDVAGKDRREVLAKWLTSTDNPYFATSVANRVWAHFFGKGIVEPVDDIRVSNPASNPELFKRLGDKLVEYKYDFKALLDEPQQLAANLRAYINGFSRNMYDVLEKFDFDNTITKLDEAGLLFQVLERFKNVDLHPDKIDNPTMGTIFEELIRRFNEALNENHGEHFTPRDVVHLMVDLMLADRAGDAEADDVTRGGDVAAFDRTQLGVLAAQKILSSSGVFVLMGWILGGYLLGSIPLAWLLTKWTTGKDLRLLGSGNVGVMNTALSAARWVGILVFLGEIGKGVVAVSTPRALGEGEMVTGLLVVAVVAGTRWPICTRTAP